MAHGKCRLTQQERDNLAKFRGQRFAGTLGRNNARELYRLEKKAEEEERCAK